MSLAMGGFAGKVGAILTPLIAQVTFLLPIGSTHGHITKKLELLHKVTYI